MKKWIAVLLTLCMLLSLGACGGKTESVPSVSAKETEPTISVEMTTDGDYVIPAQWTNNSINDGSYAYVTESAEKQTLTNDGLGHYYQIDHDDEKQVNSVTVTKQDGTPMYSLEIPFLAPIIEGDAANDYLGEYVFLEDSLWVTHYRDSYDPEQETSSWEGYLEHWDAQGNPLEKRSLAEDYGINQEDNMLTALTQGEDGGLLMVSGKELLFLSETGEITARSELPQDSWLNACRDSSGRAYLYDSMSGTLYTIDWANHALGQQLFETEDYAQILPGGGDYDFLLVNETKLSGASLTTGTVTEILRWADYDLTATVGTVEYVDEDTFLISVSSMMGDMEILYLRRVPASEVPEKETVYLAYPLAEIEEVPDRSWTEVADYTLIDQVNRFNRSSSEYRIEVVTFGSATDLQLLMQSDTPPDLICWDGDGLESPPSARLYAAKGYLTNLEPLLEQDEEFSLDDLIPRCVELLRETYGGMYVLPSSFYARTIMAPSEYVGDDMGWTLEEFCDMANSLPEDVTLWSSGGDTVLSILLSTNGSRFVDYDAGTCDFENQTLIDLLNVCRDRCTEGDDTEDDALQVVSVMGRFAEFTYNNLLPAKAAGKTMIGYPGAEGNGMCLTFQQCMSITASAKHPDAAWQFLRRFLTDDVQKQAGIFSPIRASVYQELENNVVKNNPDEATQEEYAEAIAMPYHAGCVMVYDDPAVEIALEEAAAFFAGDQTAEDTASVIQSRVSIYLGEQS